MKKILVVEDDKLLGKTFCKYLEKAGYEVFWAENAKMAYDALRSQIVDLIFLDIMMPEIDGYQVLKEIRSSKTYAHVPVVILSNLSGSSDMDRAMSFGATDFIVKSNIDLDDLIQKIKSDYLS